MPDAIRVPHTLCHSRAAGESRSSTRRKVRANAAPTAARSRAGGPSLVPYYTNDVTDAQRLIVDDVVDASRLSVVECGDRGCDCIGNMDARQQAVVAADEWKHATPDCR